MMAEFGRVKMLLFLILMLQFTAKVTGEYSYITVRDGDDVTVPCGNVKDDQDECSLTDWLFDRLGYTRAVILVRYGHVDNAETPRTKSDRLSVSEKCSLLIEKVTAEDAGRYSCRRYNASGHEQGEDSVVQLSVVVMTNRSDGDSVNCSVSASRQCRHTVRWLHEGKDAAHMKTSQSVCSSTVSFTDSSLQCEVTDMTSGEVKLFAFIPQASDYDASAATSPTTSPTDGRGNSTTTLTSTGKVHTDCSALNYIMLVMRVAEILLMTVIIVLLIRAQAKQRALETL